MKAIVQQVQPAAAGRSCSGASGCFVADTPELRERDDRTEPQYLTSGTGTLTRGAKLYERRFGRVRPKTFVVLGRNRAAKPVWARDSTAPPSRCGMATCRFLVVGGLQAKGQSGLGQDRMTASLFPILRCRKKLPGRTGLQLQNIMVSASQEKDMRRRQITSLLRWTGIAIRQGTGR